jgi:hypothetical protein
MDSSVNEEGAAGAVPRTEAFAPKSAAEGRNRSPWRWMKWLVLTPLAVVLLGLATLGSVYLPMRLPYDREEDPWLTPEKTYYEWRLDGLMKSPMAFKEWLSGHADAERQKIIALTFDDGPYPLYTPLLLAMLRHYNVKATFFVVDEGWCDHDPRPRLHNVQLYGEPRRLVANGPRKNRQLSL